MMLDFELIVRGAWSMVLSCVPTRAKRSLRNWAISVTDPTVDFRVPRLTRCSMATAGEMPVTRSTSGLLNCSTNCLA